MTNSAYYFKGIKSKTRFLNFYNAQDEALKAYESGQVTKPDSGGALRPAWEYIYAAGGANGGHVFQMDTTFTFPVEIPWNNGVISTNVTPGAAEILSHIIPARSVALGAYGGAGGDITPAVDMNAAFQFKKIHSAQFLSNYQLRKGYWDKLLSEMNLAGPQGQ